MGLNHTPQAERLHISLFGKRNAGKSSLINAITKQQLAIVSPVKGTTTDPVYKAMELLPLGPVVLIDTPGLDDEGDLGQLRIQKTYEVLHKTDVALLVIDSTVGLTKEDLKMQQLLEEQNIPYLIVMNKCDLLSDTQSVLKKDKKLWVSSQQGIHIEELKEAIICKAPTEEIKLPLVADLIEPSDFVVLVVPIDKAAPKGRLILPQQQTIRDILEADATAIVVKEYKLYETLSQLGKKPKLVITDSQVFGKVAADTPHDILLTSFSILFARYKGNLPQFIEGIKALETLPEGARVLIAEGCTHHRQCDDIGSVKLPCWIREHTGRTLHFDFCSGVSFPEDLSPYQLIVHCGGCTLTSRSMHYRLKEAQRQGIPITNYGILIAFMQGILKRSLAPFPTLISLLEEASN
ncbi:[FeFe] hydrogenase H-cluster maturation GTPase HydF [Sporanaerobium hydrogeniformans]|uniref:[FeFe] hydrogenase H-cluster maturation GTPase HydF n=1 Tax=Sporanaerobium hydrogeniformans TaxID=3072179 RepID=A0AC61DD80_9FIRM|nr:[FeFe] hydrogenase H-cluster maturation GTPase HydF [Sporanaerobium hydrogeniformans]PHV70723.1 [FeFe] hydrogenase H-cluster maturation GTPase HydF [Sporanaerobium hydrogeniformans]